MTQRRKINWRRVQATSLRHGLELCVRHASDVLNKSVERIAEEMGEASHWTLYKWLESGRMPAVKLRAFETACGIDCVTQYLAHSAGCICLRMPTGRRATHKELNELSVFAHTVLGQLLAFYDSNDGAEQLTQQITQLMEDLAYQHKNVEQYGQPQLGLDE